MSISRCYVRNALGDIVFLPIRVLALGVNGRVLRQRLRLGKRAVGRQGNTSSRVLRGLPRLPDTFDRSLVLIHPCQWELTGVDLAHPC